MQFLIIAYDGTDEGALDRRMAAREPHLVGARAMKANGSMIVGGAILLVIDELLRARKPRAE